MFNQATQTGEHRPQSMQELISCKPCDHDTQLLLGPLMLLGSWSLLSLTLTEVGRQGSLLWA